MSPLDTPLTFRWPLSKAFAAKREKRGLGSVRRFGYIELQYPEFTLRSLQRCQCATIRCRAVALSLRKAPLPSRAYPWCTRRPCWPLAFRREAPLSVQRRVWGVKRGKGTIGALSPLVSAGRARHFSAARRRQCPVCPSAAILASSGAPLYRRNRLPSVEGKEKGRTAVSAEINPLLRVKEKRTHICAEDKSLIL